MLSPPYLDCELYLAHGAQARLSLSGREYSGRPALDGELLRRLRGASLDPAGYGTLLFEALFPGDGDELLEGYREGLAIARNQRKRFRLRLHVATAAPAEIHGLHWEYLYDPREKLALARSPATAFSRYLSVPLEPGTAVVERPRLLVVVPRPRNLGEYRLADSDDSHGTVAGALSSLAETVSYEILEGPATVERIRDRLVAGGFHALHLQTHGLVDHETSSAGVVLEDDERRVRFVDEELLAEIVGGDRDLRLVTLLACHSGARSRDDPFSGLGPALVRRGIPAVVALRRALGFDSAARFAHHLYVNLAREGYVDTAVNEARFQLYLAAPERLDWGTPALFMRLPEGRLWVPDNPRLEETFGVPPHAPARQAGRSGWWRALPVVLGAASLIALPYLRTSSDGTGEASEAASEPRAVAVPAEIGEAASGGDPDPAAEKPHDAIEDDVVPESAEPPPKLPEAAAAPTATAPPAPVSPGRSEANYKMLVRSVDIACLGPRDDVPEQSLLEPLIGLLEKTLRGQGKMPVSSDRKQDLQELLATIEGSGCAGFVDWKKAKDQE